MQQAQSDMPAMVIATLLTSLLKIKNDEDDNVEFISSLQNLGIIDRVSEDLVECLQKYFKSLGESCICKMWHALFFVYHAWKSAYSYRSSLASA